MKRRTNSSLIVFLVLLAAVVVPASGAPLAEISLGFAHEASFDDDDGGWTASPVPPPPVRLYPIGSWEWGTPTSGPGAAASGSNVWATNLDGDYGSRECAAILSPPIAIPDGVPAAISLQHWLHSERLTSGSFPLQDAGRLFVTPDGGDTLVELAPNQGYDAAMSTDARRCFDDVASGALGLGGPTGTTPPPPAYETLSADLSSYAGQTIQVAISFGSSSANHRAGWYIDDVAVTIDGSTATEDFESSDGGFTLISTRKHPGPAKGWNHGVAASGPANTSPLWATNTEGDYGHDECATVESPKFQVGSELLGTANEVAATAGLPPVAIAKLQWKHWFRSNSIYGAGLILIGSDDGYQVLTPNQGYPSTITTTNLDARAGLLACLGGDGSQRVYSGLHQSLNTSMVDLSADLTPWIGKEISIRFLFASVWTPLNPTTQLGWYVDDIAAEVVLAPSLPDGVVIPEIDTTRTMAPGWTSGGTLSSWEWGTATVGPSGETTLATNLDGDHNASECSTVTSPAIPGALLSANATLTFDHWYRIASVTTSTAWSGGVVLISTDQGETWQYLDLPEYTRNAQFSPLQGCLSSHGLAPASRVFSGNKPTFDPVTVDLGAFLGADTIQVRFLFGAYTSLTEEGWYLRSVDLAGVKLL